MRLLGIDVGFAKERDTTGIAFFNDGEFGVGRATVDWASRSRLIPNDFQPTTVGIDAPLIGSDISVRRLVELEFSREPFQRRCKAGLSHAGMGLELRRAGTATRDQIVSNGVAQFGSCFEAFPNAFIGVLVHDAYYRRMPELKRGQKFDWLYDTAILTRAFDDLYKMLGVPVRLQEAIAQEKDHEHRAAWICLLTAWCVKVDAVKAVGDAEGGWFWLPPAPLWQSWTKSESQQQEIF